MKQLTLLIAFFYFAVLLTAQKTFVPDFNTLKKGDWFELEFTDDLGSGRIPFSPGDESFDGQLWLPDSLFKVTFRCNVVEKLKERLRMSFKISRILYSKTEIRRSFDFHKFTKDKDLLGYSYFDSNYPIDEHKNKDISNLIKSDSLTIDINTETGEIVNTRYCINQQTLHIYLNFIENGLQQISNIRSIGHLYFETKEIFEERIISYIQLWKQGILLNQSKLKSLKEDNVTYSEIKEYNGKRLFVAFNDSSWYSVSKESNMPVVAFQNKDHWKVARLIKSNFKEASNVRVYYKHNKNTNSNDGSIIKLAPLETMNLKTIRDESVYIEAETLNDTLCVFTFFIKDPKHGKLMVNKSEIELLLTPGDSIVVDISKGKNLSDVAFFGKGGGNSNYQYLMNKQIPINYIRLMSYIKNDISQTNQLHEIINSKKRIYLDFFNLHSQKLNTFWKKNLKKRIDYWYVSEYLLTKGHFYLYWREKSLIFKVPFDNQIFKQLNPVIDYQYRIGHEYSWFILQFINYQIHMITTFNTSNRISPEIRTALTKTIYKGYPMYWQLLRELNFSLIYYSDKLNIIERQYHEFINNCNNEFMVNQLKEVYTNLLQIQKGKNIKDFNLYITDKLKLKRKADGYILLDMLDWTFPSKDIYNMYKKGIGVTIRNHNFQDKIEIFVVRPYKQKVDWKPIDLKTPLNIIFTSLDTLRHDNIRTQLDGIRMLLIRNDGVIVNNNVSINNLDEVLSSLPKVPPGPDRSELYHVLMIIFLSVLFSGGITVIIARIRNKRILKKEEAKRRLAELELKAIRSQMNPHFMFNSLNSIQNLINKNKIKEANLYLSRFANMMRMVLNNSDKPLVPLDEEIQLIKTYLELEQLRIHFHYKINVSSELITEEEEIPGMLVQPFVENAVIHGMAPNRGGNIIVDISKNDNILRIEIIDDGIGINERSAQKGNGKAMKMVEERIKILNSQNKIPLIVDVTDMKEAGNGTGTKVVITIPV